MLIGIVLNGLLGSVQACEEALLRENADLKDRLVRRYAASNSLDQAQQDQLESVIQFLIPTGMRDEDRWAVHDGFPETYLPCIQTFVDPRFLTILKKVVHSDLDGVSRRIMMHGIHRVTLDKWDEFERAAVQYLPWKEIKQREDSELISYLTEVPISVLSDPRFSVVFNWLFPKDRMGEYKYVDSKGAMFRLLGEMNPDKLLDPNFLRTLQGVTVITEEESSHSSMRWGVMSYLNELDKNHWNAFLITVQLFSAQYASPNKRMWLFSYLRKYGPAGWGAYILEHLETSAA